MIKQHKNVIASATKQSHKLKLHLNSLFRHSFGIPRNDGIKKILLLLAILFSINSFAQETKFKSYSLSEFFKMIENEPSDTLRFKNANIFLDTITDREFMIKNSSLTSFKSIRTDSIHINKPIFFENVFMPGVGEDDTYAAIINTVVFHKPVHIKNSSLWFSNNHFLSSVNLLFDSDYNKNLDIKNNYGLMFFQNTTFELDPIIRSGFDNGTLSTGLWMDNCVFKGSNKTNDINWFLSGFNSFTFENNVFLNKHANWFSIGKNRGRINGNDFGNRLMSFFIMDVGVTSLEIKENKIQKKFLLTLPEAIQNFQMDWNQMQSGVLDGSAYSEYIFSKSKVKNTTEFDLTLRDEQNIKKYSDSARIANNTFYKSEMALLGSLNAIYKRQNDMESVNASYIALKDLETKRLAFLYKQKPSFEGFFTWKINQFLKVFSAYGTKPAKAVVFSMWVILLFAFIYLLFPNSWDAHGRKRIMNRYAFFFTYMNKKSGIHEVYLDHQQEDLLEFDEFKTLVEQQGKTVPRFFTATALPLYKWAISGTKFSASVLKRLDIMKGTWSDLPKSKRIWKSILLIGAFTIAVIYDILIKMLNALMLSINTFTTLGFGEIPIKGLPRYLAIIQGFIGWFMLTIFSVSLISQLLN